MEIHCNIWNANPELDEADTKSDVRLSYANDYDLKRDLLVHDDVNYTKLLVSAFT